MKYKATYASIFKVLCYIGAGSLSFFWLYKFAFEDEDLCLVDYKSLGKSSEESVSLPMLSLCLKNPFIEARLKQIDPTLNSTHYLNYLLGKVRDDGLKDINFGDVTVDLKRHLLKIFVVWRNGSNKSYYKRNDYTNIIYEQSYDTFNGTVDRLFFKCYSAEVNNTFGGKMKYLSFMFNQSGILHELNGSDHNVFFTYFHYPGQFLLANQNVETFTDKLNGTGYELWFTIRGYEVLKRRNKRKMTCEKNWKQYDSMTKNEHIRNHGCRPPYLYDTIETSNTCSDVNTLRKGVYEANKVTEKYVDQPCDEMSKINFGYTEVYDWRNEKPWIGDTFAVIVGFPRNVKVIEQSKAISPNSLIGIIGGYIGLFLGTIYFSSDK